MLIIFFSIFPRKYFIIRAEYISIAIESKLPTISPNFRYTLTTIERYIGARSNAERASEAQPINSAGVPRRFFPRNFIITYKFTEQPIIEVEIIRINDDIGLLLENIDKINITTAGMAEDIKTKSYNRDLTNVRIFTPEVRGIQRFSNSEDLQLLTSIKGTISEYMPTKSVKGKKEEVWEACLILMDINAAIK